MGLQSNGKSNKRRKLPSSTRPPVFRNTTPSSLSSKATRQIIQRHHTLLKAHAQAVKSGDDAAASVAAEGIAANGGLATYQRASQTGQLGERGGDTSRVLRSWLEEEKWAQA